MVRSAARTAEEYLPALPPDRRETMRTVRDVIVANLPEGYQESVEWGMLSYEIPLARYPNTYNKRPLPYVCLAAQKNYYSLYLLGAYQDSQAERAVREAFRRAGKKLDMGQSCVRFKRLDDLPLDAIGRIVAATPPEMHIAQYERGRKQATEATKATKPAKATKAAKAT